MCVYHAVLGHVDLKSASVASPRSIFKTHKKRFQRFIRRCIESYVALTGSIAVEK